MSHEASRVTDSNLETIGQGGRAARARRDRTARSDFPMRVAVGNFNGDRTSRAPLQVCVSTRRALENGLHKCTCAGHWNHYPVVGAPVLRAQMTRVARSICHVARRAAAPHVSRKG